MPTRKLDIHDGETHFASFSPLHSPLPHHHRHHEFTDLHSDHFLPPSTADHHLQMLKTNASLTPLCRCSPLLSHTTITAHHFSHTSRIRCTLTSAHRHTGSPLRCRTFPKTPRRSAPPHASVSSTPAPLPFATHHFPPRKSPLATQNRVAHPRRACTPHHLRTRRHTSSSPC